MNTLSNITEPLGWALLHFLWQGAAVAVLLRAFLWLARRSSPQVRYVASGVALLMMLGAAAGTLWWQARGVGEGTKGTARTAGTEVPPQVLSGPSSFQSLESFPSLPATPPLPEAPQRRAEPPRLPAASAAVSAPAAAERLRPLLPWLVCAWAAGVVLFSLRLLNGWRTVRRWRACGNESVPAEWSARFVRLCETLRLTRPVRLLSSATLAVPVVIGWLKPVVLVPAGLFTGIPAAQLEAILAHELAHIRRHDYLVNLLQSAVETVLFYHPAVWWVSAQLRKEREHCCDDIAASLHGDALNYARALTALEELRSAPVLSLSAAGGSLLQRVRRLAGMPEERAASVAWPLGILTLVVLAAGIIFTLRTEAGEALEPAVKQALQAEVKAQQGSQLKSETPNARTMVENALQKDSALDLWDAVPESELHLAMRNANAPGAVEFPAGTRKLPADTRHPETVKLMALWNGKYGYQLPAAPMLLLAGRVRDRVAVLHSAPVEQLQRQLLEMELKVSLTWQQVETILEAVCAADPELLAESINEARTRVTRSDGGERVDDDESWQQSDYAELAWGLPASNGLRAAWVLEPYRDYYAVGEVLRCRILFQNIGPAAVEFTTDAWHQEDQWIVKNVTLQEVKVKTMRHTGDTQTSTLRLEPGDYGLVTAHGVGIGAGDYKEAYSAGRMGVEISATAGDVLTCQWVVKLRPGKTDAVLSPPSTLTTGAVKFKVVSNDPGAEPGVGLAIEPGHYALAEGIKLQVTRVTQGDPPVHTNTATIEWYAANGQLGLKWPLELSPGLEIDPLVWQRGGTALWVVRDGAVRRIDYTNAADVKEKLFPKGESGDYGGTTGDLLKWIKELAAATRQFQDEVNAATPAAEGTSERKTGEIVINVRGDGAILRDGKTLTMEELGKELAETARTNNKQAIIIRGDVKTPYAKIVAVLDAAHKAGLHQVSFATMKADAPQPEPAGKKTVETKDGTRTEVARLEDKNQIVENTYQHEALVGKRVFNTDKKGRPRQAVIFDGNGHPLGTIIFSYDKKTDEPAEEQHYDEVGKLVRRLFYPGVLKDPKYAGRYVSFTYNSDDLKAAPVEEAGDASPTRPLSEKPVNDKGLALTVQDATGKAPVKEFRVIAGVRAGSAGGTGTINWQPHTLKEGTNGALLWPLDKAYDEMALRVEADGYMPQVYNWIEKKKGPQDLSFEMVKIKKFGGQIQMPNGKPAAGAMVALAMVQSDAVLEGGKLRHADEPLPEKLSDRWRWPRISRAAANGGFALPGENDPTAALLVIHESGVREMSLKEFTNGLYPWTGSGPHPFIKLQPWARVEGKVQWGDKPGAGQKVSLTIHRDDYGYPGIVAQYEKTTAGADGRFVFEKVLPGHVQLSCPIAAEAGNKSGFSEISLDGRIVHLTLKPGANTAVIGGSGRRVTGRLTGREKWDGVTFHFHPTAPHIGMDGDDEIWKAWSEFQKSAEGALFFRSGLKVKADGTFEIPGVLPGDYQIFFTAPDGKASVAGGKFRVSSDSGSKAEEAVNAGEFRAQP